MKAWSIAIIGVAGLLAACGGAAESDVASCQRTAQEPLSPLQETEIAEACATQLVEQLTIRFTASPEAEEDTSGCEITAVFVAPSGYATPRVDFGVMTGDGRFAGAGVAVRDFLFSDRLSNVSDMRLSSDAGCNAVSVTVQQLQCRVSADSSEDYQECGPVTFEGTELFADFQPLEN